MVVSGEFDDQCLASELVEFPGCELAVVPIETCPAGKGQPQPDQQRGKGPPHHAKTSVSLADVVEKGSPNHCDVLFPGADHRGGSVVTVSLICVVL